MNLSYAYHLLIIIGTSILTLASVSAYGANSTDQSFAEHQIKAVYIYRLANFIRWDHKTVTTPMLCAIGRDSTTVTLEKLIISRSESKRLHTMINLTEASLECDLLYITESKLQILQTIPQYSGLLTVSDSSETLNRGGMIELRKLNQQIKPALSLANIEKASLTVSSQLLKIAILDTPHPVNAGGRHE
ncbi:YfiR family protein [Photobacterium nomapromontoriensis]|uniref:YfiR family protein n=1 Tax=Photobacterium nomapromontoriensis TaxID=2910237 RepID=UPI003D12D42D